MPDGRSARPSASAGAATQPRGARVTPTRPAIRHHSRRWERDQDRSRWLLLLGAALAVLVVLALLGGWVMDNVVQAQEVVATVRGQTISARQLVDEMRPAAQAAEAQARRAVNAGGANRAGALQQLEQQKRQLPDQTLDQLVEQTLLRQEADRRGIQVTPAEVDAELRKQVAEIQAREAPSPTPDASAGPTTEASPAPAAAATANATGEASPTPAAVATGAADATPNPTASPTPFPTPTAVPTLEPAAFDTAFKKLLDESGLTEERVRELVRQQLLREQLQTAFGDEVPTSQEQVRARHILLPDEAQAKQALARLEAGEDFATVAKEVSTDPGSKDKGGDLGWFPRGLMNKEFEDAAFALQPGQRSGIVQSPNGYHIIEVLERDPNRPVEASTLEQLKSKAFSTWLADQRASPDVKLELTAARRDWALRQIGVRP